MWGTSDDTRTAYLDSQVIHPPSALIQLSIAWESGHCLRYLLLHGVSLKSIGALISASVDWAHHASHEISTTLSAVVTSVNHAWNTVARSQG